MAYVTQRSDKEIREGYEAWMELSRRLSHQWVAKQDGSRGPIPSHWDASSELSTCIYVLCRLMRPLTVIETGVGRGMTTMVILTALKENGAGHLYSVEFPRLVPGYTNHVGELVARDLRDSWSLKLGPSKDVLPRLLRELGSIDVFTHDSAHSYHPQKMEYELAIAHLAPGGVLISDDVNNDAFVEVAESHRCRWSIVRQSKASPIGLLSKT